MTNDETNNKQVTKKLIKILFSDSDLQPHIVLEIYAIFDLSWKFHEYPFICFPQFRAQTSRQANDDEDKTVGLGGGNYVLILCFYGLFQIAKYTLTCLWHEFLAEIPMHHIYHVNYCCKI